jgi:hypothetical protein
MLHSNRQYPDLKFTALLLKLAIALDCSQLLAVPKSPYRGTRYLNLVTPTYGELRGILAELKQRAGTTFDLIVYSNLRFSAGVLSCLLPCFNF